MRKLFLFLLFWCFVIASAYPAINPNPIISQGKTVYTSKGNFNNLVDNVFRGNTFSVTDNSWIAIPIDSGPTKVIFSWNNPDYYWSNSLNSLTNTSCVSSGLAFPVDYNILVSGNSTNGTDGSWQIVDSIRGNIVTARSHIVDFTGSKWIKMQIIKGGGPLDEIQVFDASKGADDTWFFIGTSISANAFKGTPPDYNYADLIHATYSTYSPAMVRGAIACINSSDLVRNLSQYLKIGGNMKYWAIEMGTNDAWGGTNGNVATFKNNLQKVIDSCKLRGIIPIIAKVLATNKSAAKWQVHEDFQKAIDELTATNNLIPGPDLYNWFLAHPDNLNSDGVHPSADGSIDIQKLWALKMDSLYGGCNKTEIKPYYRINNKDSIFSAVAVMYTRDTVKFSPVVPEQGGTWSWTGPLSFTANTREITISNAITTQAGTYTCSYTNSKGCKSNYSFRLWVNKRVGVESANSFKAEIFPNPSGDGNFIVLVGNIAKDAQLQVFDIQGKIVYNTVLKHSRSEIKSNLAKGIYPVKIINGTEITGTNIVIK